MIGYKWHRETLRALFLCLNTSSFNSSAYFHVPLASVSLSLASQPYADLTTEDHHLDDCSRSNSKHRIDLLGYASLPKICFPSRLHFSNQWLPSVHHLQTKLQDYFCSSLFTHLYHVSHYTLSFLAIILLSPVLIWVGAPTFTASSLWLEPHIAWKMIFKSALLSPSFCSNLTAVAWCSFWA